MYTKVIVSFAITILFVLILGLASIMKMIELADLTQKLYDHPFTVTNATKTVESNLISMHRYMKDVVLAKNNAEIEIAVAQVNTGEIAIYKQFEIIFERYLGDKDDIKKSYDAFRSWKSIRDEVIFLMRNGQKDKAAEITKGKGAVHVGDLNKQVNKLIAYAHNKADYFQKNALKSKKTSIMIILVLLGSILIIVIFILVLLIRNLSNSDKERKRYFRLIDQNIMSATLDKDGKIIDASTALARHLAFAKSELLETPGYFLYSDCEQEEQTAIKQIIQSGQDWSGEIQKLDDYGEVQWLHVHIHPVFDDDNDLVGYTNILNDISSKKRIEEISKLDGLTDLYNRRHFDERFAYVIKSARKSKLFLCFIMLDIDHFKEYNDTYGHQAGDQTLKAVAAVLKNSLKRRDDCCFRLGGEEFGILYMVSSPEDALDIAKKAKDDIEHLQINHSASSVSEFVTVSMGAYIIKPNDHSNVDSIYDKTDKALYKAKETGRNQLVEAQY